MAKFAKNGPQDGDAGEYYSPQDESSTIDLKELYAAVYRSRFVILGIMAVCLILGITLTLLMTRQYFSVSTIEVRQEAEKVLGTEEDREDAVTKVDVERFLDTQIDLVKSRTVTIAVAEELNLFRNDDFLNAMNVGRVPEADSVRTEQEARRELVIETLVNNLEANYTGQTRLLLIGFYSPDPQLSARVANAYAVNFIRSNLERKSESSSYALDFLRNQLREAQVRLEQSERDALDYARRTRIVDASNAAGRAGNDETTRPSSLVTAQLVQLNNAYSGAVADRVAAQQRWRSTQGMPLLEIPEVLGNQAIQGLLERRALVQSEYEELLETRQEDHPAARQTAAQLAEINRQLNAVASNIKGSIRNEYRVALSREEQLEDQIEGLKGDTLVEQNQGIELSILRREADTNRQQYEALLRRYNQLNAESGVQSNNLLLVDRATVNPEPAWPNVPLNIILALIAGMIFSGLYLIIYLQVFEKIRTPFDVSERLGLPLLGAVPTTGDVLADMNDPKSEVSEAFNLVRTALTLASGSGAPQSVVITSAQASEGKSSSCASLAIAFSRLGKKVVIIDLDLRRPNAHKLLNLHSKVGASTVLSGEADVDAAIQPSSYPGLDVISAGPIPPSPTDLIMGAQFNVLLEQLSQRYDLILVDSPPLLALADAEILSSKTEATLLVIESGRNNRLSEQNAINRLDRAGANLAGALLTKYDPNQAGYRYYGEYSYVYNYESRGDKR